MNTLDITSTMDRIDKIINETQKIEVSEFVCHDEKHGDFQMKRITLFPSIGKLSFNIPKNRGTVENKVKNKTQNRIPNKTLLSIRGPRKSVLDLAFEVQNLKNLGHTQTEIAERFHKTQATISNLLTIAQLPSDFHDVIKSNKMSAHLALAIYRKNGSDHDQLMKIFNSALNGHTGKKITQSDVDSAKTLNEKVVDIKATDAPETLNPESAVPSEPVIEPKSLVGFITHKKSHKNGGLKKEVQPKE